MKNLWSDQDAAASIKKYAAEGVNEDVALRVYTSRLIGVEPQLVIHGGGNTSVKTRIKDFLETERDVICVKGSGWDLATIEPAGLPALELAPLHEVRKWEKLSDEDMVAFQRLNLLDPSSPNPSVEALLHAFLPQKFVDHSHATAILALSDQADSAKLCRDLFGVRVAFVPYVMPGFLLAKATADAFDKNPDVEGIILERHGLFTFGETARKSYDRMIAFVTKAEEAIEKAASHTRGASSLERAAPPQAIAPILRGACANEISPGDFERFILDFRTSDAIREYVDRETVAEDGVRGVVTPDHIIRTKNKPLIAPFPTAGDLDSFKEAVRSAVEDYRTAYDVYFERNNARYDGGKQKLDSAPRVILAPGIGLFGLGRSAGAAKIAADLAEITVDTVLKADRVGRFEALGEAELFDMEYWSLEQAKLGKAKPKALQGQIAVVTGAAGAIGAATARAFAEQGAAVALLDINLDAVKSTAEAISGSAFAVPCDVTDESSIARAVNAVVMQFGGLDVLVSNAGAAYEGPIADLDDNILRNSLELNFFSHQSVAQHAVRIMRDQETGGALLFNASKQAINPGANFGAYGTAKAATLFLARQYALECGKYGIRANVVNADRIRSGILSDDMIRRRAGARGLTEDAYLGGNLLGLEVRAEDVAQAFVHHALALRTTGDVTTVDGGNVAAMLR